MRLMKELNPEHLQRGVRTVASATRSGSLYLAPLLALWLCGASAADTPSPAPGPASAAAPAAGAAAGQAPQAPARSPYAVERFSGRAGIYYGLIWGVDSIQVRLVESGELVRFSFRVLDPAKAKILNDKQTEARLEDPRAGVSLSVPVMEKVGQLRQTAPPEAGRAYWMTFSNKGRLVARGDRVDVVIGQFRANNLVVD